MKTNETVKRLIEEEGRSQTWVAREMNRVNPGVRTYMDVMLLGEGCFSMDKTPTIEVNRCRVKGMSEDKCSDAIRWFKKNQ